MFGNSTAQQNAVLSGLRAAYLARLQEQGGNPMGFFPSFPSGGRFFGFGPLGQRRTGQASLMNILKSRYNINRRAAMGRRLRQPMDATTGG